MEATMMPSSLAQPGTAAIEEPFPSKDTKDTDEILTHAGYRITARKLPILKAGPIEDMTTRLGITPPEMIFGDNLVRITNLKSGWSIEFNAFDALDRVDKTGEKMLSVAYSGEWQRSRERKYGDQDIKGVVRPFDWSYSTDYAGTVSTSSPAPRFSPHPHATNGNDTTGSTDAGAIVRNGSGAQRPPHFQRTDKTIPLELLARRDPILFFTETLLYEDELADNGISLLSIKIRVMPQRLLLLQRFYMRLDDVVFRVRDTRVYVEFGTGLVMREYSAREEGFENVRKRFAGRKGEEGWMGRPEVIVEGMPVVARWCEELVLK